MPVSTAGVLLFRRHLSRPEVFLVHPGGPYWAHKDIGAWSLPKGIVETQEDELACAQREFLEETGYELAWPDDAHDLGVFPISTSKRLRVWAVEGDCNPANLVSNEFEIEWPPKSGHRQRFPEVDRGGWFDLVEAARRIVKGQLQVIEAFCHLCGKLGVEERASGRRV